MLGAGGLKIISCSIPVGIEHIQTTIMLQSKPVDRDKWSILCPSAMLPAGVIADLKLLEKPRKYKLLTKEDAGQQWKDHWLSGVPLVGAYINTFAAYLTSTTDLEDFADLIAENLASSSLKWNSRKVGVKEKSSK